MRRRRRVLREALSIRRPERLSSMVEAGARITLREENISRLFYCLEDVRDPKILPVIDMLSLDLRRYGGKPLRAAAHSGNRMLVEYLYNRGRTSTFISRTWSFSCLDPGHGGGTRESLELLSASCFKGGGYHLAGTGTATVLIRQGGTEYRSERCSRVFALSSSRRTGTTSRKS